MKNIMYPWYSIDSNILTVKRFESDFKHLILKKNRIACTDEETVTITTQEGDTKTIEGKGYFFDCLGVVNCPECIQIMKNATFDKSTAQLSAILIDDI